MANRNSGFTVIKGVIGMALMGIIVAVFSGMMSNNARGQRHLELRGEYEDVKNAIRVSFDCERTMKALGTACSGKTEGDNKWVRMLRSDDSVLFDRYPADTLTFGSRNNIRIKCIDDGPVTRFVVEASRMIDPVHRKKVNWHDIFRDIPVVCKSRGDGWYAAKGKQCPAFCNSLGMKNTLSPDNWSVGKFTGLKGSYCASGEVIPPSARQAAKDGYISFTNGCFWNCNTGLLRLLPVVAAYLDLLERLLPVDVLQANRQLLIGSNFQIPEADFPIKKTKFNLFRGGCERRVFTHKMGNGRANCIGQVES